MKLALSEAQCAALLAADFLPDALREALKRAKSTPEGEVLDLTLEEATAMEELCAWNVKTGPDGELTALSEIFDAVVRAIITHPDY